MTRMEIYRKHVADGECPSCGIKITDFNYIICEECRRRQNERRSKLRSERSSEGICYKCKKPFDGKTKLCKSCAKEWNAMQEENRRENFEFRKKLGLCTKCGKYTVYGDYSWCEECREKERVRKKTQISRDKAKFNEEKRNYQKKRREKLKSLGICTKCGKRKSVVGVNYCDFCRAKERQRKMDKGKAFETQRKKEQKIAHGICLLCEEPALEGKKYCYYHFNCISIRMQNKAKRDGVE